MKGEGRARPALRMLAVSSIFDDITSHRLPVMARGGRLQAEGAPMSKPPTSRCDGFGLAGGTEQSRVSIRPASCKLCD